MKQFRFKEWPGVLWGICRKAPIFEGLMALKKTKKRTLHTQSKSAYFKP